jgi:hypothetical protein
MALIVVGRRLPTPAKLALYERKKGENKCGVEWSGVKRR